LGFEAGNRFPLASIAEVLRSSRDGRQWSVWSWSIESRSRWLVPCKRGAQAFGIAHGASGLLLLGIRTAAERRASIWIDSR
jgi:hypothetical protein